MWDLRSKLPRGGTIFHQLMSRLPSRSASALLAHPVSRRTLNHGSVRLLRQSVSIPPTRPPSPARRANPRLRTLRGSRAKAGCARQHARSLTGGVNGFDAPPSPRAPRAVRIAPRRRAPGSSRAVVPRIHRARRTRRATNDARAVRITPRRPMETRNPRVSTQIFFFKSNPPASRPLRETDEPIPSPPESI